MTHRIEAMAGSEIITLNMKNMMKIVSTLILIAIIAMAAMNYWAPSGQYTVGWEMLGLFVIALVCEFTDSTLGMGYGTILTPTLILFGYDAKLIVPAILVSELLTGFTAAGGHHASGNANLKPGSRGFKVATILSLCSIVGTIAAVVIATKISKQLLTTWIGVLVFAIGVVILLMINRSFRFSWARVVGLGLVASFNKGMSGGGYGPLVTGGQVVAGVDSKSAIAITSLAEAFTCVIGIIMYVYYGKTIFWHLAIPLTLGALCSVPLSVIAVKKVKTKALQITIGVVTMLLGILMLWGIS
ncbi:MAG: sulfite exporter TauE/SafE family protein [Candidatus Peribacteraceae bacterium]|nr:sulfite exporter TauE/SafE family protein [Candidatus Peribacteraceae bacterium]